ncbi:MAG TPA: FKBP-type peptidyl-prolyl cis-trans isomerase [Saprospiraceae bacterium]|nr:FKBP-type peptidyl-prolyl cis-trans isomerase [Saprospiraceae bacterium]HQW56144.1 FKBP-type peptidyl-prolyl cis-trans isomerase [Saprospiraceae bacterium]
MDSLSYSLGVLLAQNIKTLGLEKLSSEDIAKGIDDVLNDKETAISVNDANSMVSNEIAMINEKKSGPVLEEGKKFLEENAKKPGVKTTASGLQYEIITSGTGATPKATDEVTTNYRGTLINGKQFDSSYDRGEPAKFPVNRVIPGWTEALQMMKEGDKWRLYIPYNLAYGERGAGQDIPPFATLIFDIELIKVN